MKDADSRSRLRLWLRLLKTTRLVENGLRERLRGQFDTTLPRFDVLAALQRNPAGLRMSALSSVLKVSNGNVTGIVERLVSDGLVERKAVEGDRRAMMVRLTPAGAERFAVMAVDHARWIDEFLADFTNEEAEEMDRRLAKALKGQTETK